MMKKEVRALRECAQVSCQLRERCRQGLAFSVPASKPFRVLKLVCTVVFRSVAFATPGTLKIHFSSFAPVLLGLRTNFWFR